MNKTQTAIHYRNRAATLLAWSRRRRGVNPLLAFCAFYWSQRLLKMARNVEAMPAGEFYAQRYAWLVGKCGANQQAVGDKQLSLF